MLNDKIKQNNNSVNSEKGFVLITTMLVLVVLTVLCIGALDNSTFEVQIAANDRLSRVAFNLADGGVYSAGNLISETIGRTSDPAYVASGLLFVNIPAPLNSGLAPSPNAVDFYHQRVLGLTPLRNVAIDGPYDSRLSVPNGQGDIYTRIAARATEVMAGGGAEFATGAAGVGTGSAAGVAITYDIDVDSYAGLNRNARSQLAVRYRKVLGAAGGL